MDEYLSWLEGVLRCNALVLFDLDGTQRNLAYERHITDDPEFAELSRSTILQLTIDLWASWLMHLRQSTYQEQVWSCVHVEMEWLAGRVGSPPCVMLHSGLVDATAGIRVEVPPGIIWKSAESLGPIQAMRFTLEDAGECLRLILVKS